MDIVDLNDTQILTLAQAAGVSITESDASEIKHQINAIIQMIEPIDIGKTPTVEPLPIDLPEYTNYDKTSDPDSKPSILLESTDHSEFSLTELAKNMRTKQTSATEILKIFLKRIDSLNPKLSAFTDVYYESSLAEAKLLDDEAHRGVFRSALHGLPVGIKEQIDVAGRATTGGSLIFKTNITPDDATVVSKLRESGAVIIGKLNMMEFAIAETIEFPWGTPLNPWNTERTPGGSSSGSAIAVATSMVPATLGGDTGGSIRMPASLCGIVGFRPTYGRVSRAGSLSACWSMDTLGPFTKTVSDCALMMESISGFDKRDIYSNKRSVPPYFRKLDKSEHKVKGLKIALISELLSPDFVEPEVINAVENAAKVFEVNGAKVDRISVPRVKDAGITHWTICFTEFAQANKRLLQNHLQELTHMVKIAVATGTIIPGGAYYKALQLRELIKHDLLKPFEDFDLILTPTMTSGAQPPNSNVHTNSKEEVLEGLHGAPKLTAPFNLAGLPGLSIPCGFTSEKLPIGLQIVGKPFDETTVLQAAYLYESNTDWHTYYPPIY